MEITPEDALLVQSSMPVRCTFHEAEKKKKAKGYSVHAFVRNEAGLTVVWTHAIKAKGGSRDRLAEKAFFRSLSEDGWASRFAKKLLEEEEDAAEQKRKAPPQPLEETCEPQLVHALVPAALRGFAVTQKGRA